MADLEILSPVGQSILQWNKCSDEVSPLLSCWIWTKFKDVLAPDVYAMNRILLNSNRLTL